MILLEPHIVSVDGVTYVNGSASEYTIGTEKASENNTQEKNGWENFLSVLGSVLSAIFTQQKTQNTPPIYTGGNYPQVTTNNNSNILILSMGILLLLIVTKTIKI